MYRAQEMQAWANAHRTAGVWLPVPRPFPRPFIEQLHFKMLAKQLQDTGEEVEFTWMALSEGFYKMTQSMEMSANHEGYNPHWYAMGASTSGFIYANRFSINDPIKGAPIKFDARKEFFIPSHQANRWSPLSSFMDLNGSDNQYGRLVGSTNMVYTVSAMLTDLYKDRYDRDEREF